MSVLALTTAAALLVSSPGSSADSDATVLAANGGFLLGNAHRCGIATDRIVRAGQLVRGLILAAARDEQEQKEATDQFATFFMATAVPAKGAKLVASCQIVASELSRLEQHQLAGNVASNLNQPVASGSSSGLPGMRASDGE